MTLMLRIHVRCFKWDAVGYNGHETDLEMSPGPLGTTILEKKYIRIMGNLRLRLEIGFETGLEAFWRIFS